MDTSLRRSPSTINFSISLRIFSISDSFKSLIFVDLLNVKEEIVFKNEIGRIRDIQVHPYSGKIYFLSEDGLWLMEKN